MSRTTYYITYGDSRNDVLYLYDTTDSANKFARLYQVNAALLADYVSASPSYATWDTLTGFNPLWSTIVTPLAPPPQPLGTTGPLVAFALGGTYVAGRVDAGAITIARHDLWGDAGEVHAQTFGAVVSAGSFTALAVADNEVYRGDLGQGGVYNNTLSVWQGPGYDVSLVPELAQPVIPPAFGDVLIFPLSGLRGRVLSGGTILFVQSDASNNTDYWEFLLDGVKVDGSGGLSIPSILAKNLSADDTQRLDFDFSGVTSKLLNTDYAEIFITATIHGTPGTLLKCFAVARFQDVL